MARPAIVIVISILLCVAAAVVFGWERGRRSAEALPPGLQRFDNVREVRLVSVANEPAGDWWWSIATIVELYDGAHIVPVVRVRRPLADAPGSRLLVADPIQRPGEGMLVYIPAAESIAAVHVLIRAARRGLVEQDVWRLLTVRQGGLESGVEIEVPAVKSLPPLDSLPHGDRWYDLLRSASDWYQRQQK
jgi:hypothetical protein